MGDPEIVLSSGIAEKGSAENQAVKVTTIKKLSGAIKTSIARLQKPDKIGGSEDILVAISKLGKKPNGASAAAQLVLLLAKRYFRHLAGDVEYGELPDKDLVTCCDMDSTLLRLLLRNQKDILNPQNTKGWNLPVMLDKLAALHDELDRNCVMEWPLYFDKSLRTLQDLETRRLFRVRVMVAVSHRLPAEMVDMICEAAI
ncbi:hypothetical protein LTR10_012070 [Elasticomyces elasticus]|nr:hypothetical protein LTR10_012070 [Elasticomyces elasticus]KAK4969012.1 hypothetical protein LTR42_009291 [Elasticomyces elasticus]